MTRLSGWCSAPDGFKPMCAGCKVLDCGCGCHQSRSTTGVSASADGKIQADERPDRANESGLSDPSASLDYTEERPG